MSVKIKPDILLLLNQNSKNNSDFESNLKDNYNMITCSSTTDAMKIFNDFGEIPIIVIDDMNYKNSDIQIVENLKIKCPDSIIILISEYQDVEMQNKGKLNKTIKASKFNYIIDSITKKEIDRILKEGLDKYNLIKKNKKLIKRLENNNRKLEKTERLLQYQDKQALIGTLAAGLTHEIRNQLNIIALLEYIEENEKISNDGLKDIKRIIDTKERIVTLIDEIRDLSCSNVKEYDMEIDSLNKLIDESIVLAKTNKDVKPIKIETTFDFNGIVKINKDKIIQVMINLIFNSAFAIKDKEDGFIRIETSNIDNYACVKVIDNGIGISKNQMKKIWDPFYTSKKDKGTGLGLDICKRIISTHKGKIFCESVPNKETVFNILLPLH